MRSGICVLRETGAGTRYLGFESEYQPTVTKYLSQSRKLASTQTDQYRSTHGLYPGARRAPRLGRTVGAWLPRFLRRTLRVSTVLIGPLANTPSKYMRYLEVQRVCGETAVAGAGTCGGRLWEFGTRVPGQTNRSSSLY